MLRLAVLFALVLVPTASAVAPGDDEGSCVTTSSSGHVSVRLHRCLGDPAGEVSRWLEGACHHAGVCLPDPR